ncbi:MAG: hypothetical protein NTY12_01880 [Candidatus Falkowbacteria bacterium]|nr:hypothetical protein [Candidatus Falkowbacteria bacterium]
MVVNIDISGFEQLLYLPTGTILWRLFFWYFGWMPVAFVTLWGIIQLWLEHREGLWFAQQKFILLAIDIPRNNAQSLMAVENMFVYFAGAHGTLSLIETWWEGKFQLGFSFEIVSIGGYIQFLVRAPEKFRNLVETAVYSQYPDAEIYEVEDYTTAAPNIYPDEEYDIWGSEFVQVKDQLLPIRTYPEFEHQFGAPETTYRDTMASLMDLMSSLQRGEQLWYQIVLVPTDEAWKDAKKGFIGKILGEKKAASGANNAVDKIVDWMGDASEQVYSIWGDIDATKKKDADPLKMMNLKPAEKAQIEAVEAKVAKLGFEVCIRVIYFARKEVKNVPKAVNGFVGYIKQFNTGGLNSLKPDTKITMTSANYFFTKQRVITKKNNIMRGYKSRSKMRGRKPWILNVEELATLWHFPIDAVVKAPLVQRASARRVEPPMSLPFGSDLKKSSVNREPIFDQDFEVEDDNAVAEEEDFKPETKKTSTKPAFMDDDEALNEEAIVEPEVIEPEMPAADPVNEKSSYTDASNDKPAYTPHEISVALETHDEPKARRGQPPPNLPFVD